MKSKIFLLSLGCPRNLVDSEVLMGILEKGGFSLTEDTEKADVFIVNTCAFIESAKRESIDAIFQMASVKKNREPCVVGGKKRLIVTGCLSQRYPLELKKEIPEIDGIFGSSDFIKIPEFIKDSSTKKATTVSKTPSFLYNHKFNRPLITPRHYAYIKLQEGCMNHCSYCVIPKLRGPYRSREMGSIIKEARNLKARNIKEINLIGQDITLYGIDRYKKSKLSELLKRLAKIMKDRWIRLLYTHPAHYNDELISVIACEDAICKYIDLPVQHINNKILKKMNRNTSKKQIIALIEKIRKKIPGIAIRTTVMIGFPGETEEAFEELLIFIKDMKFDRLGAFKYSREEDTHASQMTEQIPEAIKDERYEHILKIQQGISKEKNNSYLGKIFRVLIDEKIDISNTHFLGRTQMDAPLVDGNIYLKSDKITRIGAFGKARVTDTLEYDLVGEVL